jgi:hypothetical protein
MEATATKSAKEIVQAAWNKRPLIISGPCSAETEEQTVQTIERLARTGKVDMETPDASRQFRRDRYQGVAVVAAGKAVDGIAGDDRSGYCKAGGRCLALRY